MKHKRFDETHPYTYFIRRKSDGMKYHGVRVYNVKLGLSPHKDFGDYLQSISQHKAVQSQKKSQRIKGYKLLSSKELYAS